MEKHAPSRHKFFVHHGIGNHRDYWGAASFLASCQTTDAVRRLERSPGVTFIEQVLGGYLLAQFGEDGLPGMEAALKHPDVHRAQIHLRTWNPLKTEGETHTSHHTNGQCVHHCLWRRW